MIRASAFASGSAGGFAGFGGAPPRGFLPLPPRFPPLPGFPPPLPGFPPPPSGFAARFMALLSFFCMEAFVFPGVAVVVVAVVARVVVDMVMWATSQSKMGVSIFFMGECRMVSLVGSMRWSSSVLSSSFLSGDTGDGAQSFASLLSESGGMGRVLL
jgi:hypothetical protein